jgi:hypothetical protein
MNSLNVIKTLCIIEFYVVYIHCKHIDWKIIYSNDGLRSQTLTFVVFLLWRNLSDTSSSLLMSSYMLVLIEIPNCEFEVINHYRNSTLTFGD